MTTKRPFPKPITNKSKNTKHILKSRQLGCLTKLFQQLFRLYSTMQEKNDFLLLRHNHSPESMLDECAW